MCVSQSRGSPRGQPRLVQEVGNGQPFVCEGQKGEAAAWVPSRGPGSCTGVGLGMPWAAHYPEGQGSGLSGVPSSGSLWSPSWASHFRFGVAGSVSRRGHCLSRVSSLLLSAPSPFFSLSCPLPLLASELMRWVPGECPGSLGRRWVPSTWRPDLTCGYGPSPICAL